MTLIECFTASHTDNIAACLALCPDRMVLMGNASEMEKPARRYRDLLRQRGMSTEILLWDVQHRDPEGIHGALKKVLLGAKECVIDLSGGDEPVILAVGAVWAELPAETRKGIRIVKFDHAANGFRDCIRDNARIKAADVHLTVEEMIALCGGTVLPDAYQPPADSSPRDLAGLWDVVSEAPRDWNRWIMQLREFESRSDSQMQVFLPLAHLRGGISDFDRKEENIRSLLDKLQRKGVVDDRSSAAALEYTYNSRLLRFCTEKAGNVLEVKTLLEGRWVQQKDVPYFGDCQMSVSIDWDGIVHDPGERIPETRNEIDVILMHGTVPLFISCKNGNIGEEELYKLHTVAERFGGPYAKKMLIATELDRKSPAANRAFIQRAWDMDIFLVTDAAELSETEWRQILIKAMQ